MESNIHAPPEPVRLSVGPEFFEQIANDPAVFPSVSVAGQERISLGAAWNECIGIEFPTGGWIMHHQGGGRFEVHTLFLPGSKDVAGKASFAALFMFASVGATELVTKVPVDLPHAKALAVRSGFRPLFRREAAWPRDSGAVDLEFFRLTADEWIIGNRRLIELGEQFHGLLGEKLSHGEDAVHDAFVGFAIACGQAGQLARGVDAYNRWARFAGYEPVSLDGDTVRFDGVAATLTHDGITIMEDH